MGKTPQKKHVRERVLDPNLLNMIKFFTTCPNKSETFVKIVEDYIEYPLLLFWLSTSFISKGIGIRNLSRERG